MTGSTEETICALRKGLDVVEHLVGDPLRPKSVPEIAQAAGLSVTTTWRVLEALEGAGWAAYDVARAGWKVGDGLAAIARACEDSRRRRVSLLPNRHHPRRYLDGHA